jgi:glycosyltransferase involved in cell wall biosynthesis
VKVLVASHLYPSLLSQTWGSFVHNQVRFLQAHCQVQVVSPTPFFPFPGFGAWSAYRRVPRREWRDGIEVQRPRYAAWPRRLFFARVWRSYLRALERAQVHSPDLIHAHCAYPDGLAAAELGKRLGRPVVVTVHGHDLKDLPRHPRWRALVVRALQQARSVVAVSQDLRERALALGLAPEKVHLIPNGVDCQVFAPDFARRPGEGGWRLLYVGRFDPAKGIGILLEALARLRGQGRDVRLSLIGGNPLTGGERPFRRQVARLGLADRVEFLGEVPWNQVPRHMASADLFALPSFSEGLPLVLLEALSCGLPILSTRCGGPEEIVGQQVGRLVTPGDVDELQDALEEMLDQYQQYDRRAIRRLAEERYDYRHIAGRLFALYEQALSASGAPLQTGA